MPTLTREHKQAVFAFKEGDCLRLEQAAEMATHLAIDDDYNEKTLCGMKRVRFASWDCGAVIRTGGQLKYHDGTPALRYVDCKRCQSIYLKKTAA